jgi:uncharacterized protein
MEDGFLEPTRGEDSAPFWAGTQRGQLLMQRCGSCRRWRFPPRPMCPHCRSVAVDWEPVSGRGTIWSFVVPHAPLLPAYERRSPFAVILVQLDEDPTLRLTGNLLTSVDGHVDEIDPASIEIGQRVQVVFQRHSDELTLPQWVRLAG